MSTVVLFDLSILATRTRVRGIGRYAGDLALGLSQLNLARSGIELRFIESVDWSGRARIVDDPAPFVRRAAETGQHEDGQFEWAYRLRLGLARAARRTGAALVHLPHTEATPLFMPSLLRLVTCHDLIPLRFPKQYVRWTSGFRAGRRLLDLRRFKSADHVVAISHATANDLVELLGVSREKITVVPNGVDLARWQPAALDDDVAIRERHGLPPRYLVVAGDADWRKNCDGMLAALGIARRTLPDLQLAWAGMLTIERAREVQQAGERAGVAQALRMLGWVPDRELAAIYRGAFAMLMVSRAEGFGLPVVEAMASGTPVVTSNTSSLREIAEDAALLADPEDPAAIASAIVSLSDADLRTRLIRAGLSRAARYSLEEQASRMLTLYRSLV